MTTSYYADRSNLWHLMQRHPHWSQEQLAQALGRSKSWVYKWQKRFETVPEGDEQALHQVAQGLSRARKHPSERVDPAIETLILSIRETARRTAAHSGSKSDSLLLAQADHAVGKRSALAHLNTHHLSHP